MPRLKLTKKNIDARAVPVPGKVQQFYWDPETRGFGLQVSAKSKVFLVQHRGKRRAIGEYGHWTPDEAKKRACEMIRAIDLGEDPLAQRKGLTLAAALADFVQGLQARGKSPRSIAAVKKCITKYLPEWTSRPIASISKREAYAKHRQISERAPALANMVFRWFRAVINDANKRSERDIPNPCRGVVWNKERRVQSPIPWANLPAWRKRLEVLNPVRRDLLLLIIYTGLRSEDAASIRREDVNFERGILHRPNPKGGPDKAFDIPLNGPALEILRRRGEGPWLFPAASGDGYIVERRWGRKGQESPHRLRDTYITAGHEIGISIIDIKILVNHSKPGGDTTLGYMLPSVEYLREKSEAIARFLSEKMVATAECPNL